MLSFKQFINEAETSGVDFEWAIVYWALKSAGFSDEELIKRNKKLHPYEGKIDTDAKKAISNVPSSLHKTAYHSDELKINGNPEPKTDICFGANQEYKVSVKMAGAIQIASGEGKSSAATINSALTEYYKENPITDQTMTMIVDKIANMPTKMLTKKNLAKAKENKPNDYNRMTIDGEILPEFDWDKFKNDPENKQMILDVLRAYVANHPRFLHILVDEALTGRRVFKNGKAAANWIITPKHFIEINDAYVSSVVPKVKIDLRAKSRSGITSATMRFDYKTESRFTDSIKSIAGKIKSFFSGLLKNIFDGHGEFSVSIPIE